MVDRVLTHGFYLITYNIPSEHAHVDDFGEDTDAALAAYSAAERVNRGTGTSRSSCSGPIGLGGVADEIVRRELEARGLRRD